MVNQFQIALAQGEIKCDICHAKMIPIFGGGWDNDRIVCSDSCECGAEIEYPTSTEYEGNNDEQR